MRHEWLAMNLQERRPICAEPGYELQRTETRIGGFPLRNLERKFCDCGAGANSVNCLVPREVRATK
jgi:hypothetical protein